MRHRRSETRVAGFALGMALLSGPGWSPVAAQARCAGMSPYDTLPNHEWYYRTGDREAVIYVCEIGQGEPVVVLHGGFGAEHSYMRYAIAGLEDRRRFVLFDQRGSLRSPVPADSSVTIDDLVADLEMLRRHLLLDRMTLLSHSSGTYLALRYLEAHPDRVGRLVLTGALPVKSGTYLDSATLALAREVTPRIRAHMSRPAIDSTLRALGLTGDSLSARERADSMRVRFAGPNLSDIANWERLTGGGVFYDGRVGQSIGGSVGNDYDLSGAVREHDFPVTIISGEDDFADPGGILNRHFLGDLEHVRVTNLEDAGHNAWLDRPDAFRAALRRALVGPGG